MKVRIAIFLALIATLTGCATYRTTLTNSQGQSVTCEASGKNGIVTGYYLRRGFEDCLEQARAAGYTETQSAQQASAK